MLGSIKILSKKSWPDFVKTLRHVHLLGDKKIFPYQKAKIEPKIVNAEDVYPISKYVLKSSLAMQRQLHDLLLSEHKLNSLDLNGHLASIDFEVKGERGIWLMSPPIVEISLHDGGKPVLVDGEHRFVMARKLGQKVRVILISNVARQCPVVATPIEWSDVVEYDQVPDLSLKRDYRFDKLADFPDISSFSQAKITEKNFRYFFYRNLEPVCTTAIRKPGKK